MRMLLPVLLLIATPVFACCPVDTDTLLTESGDEGLLNLIAGQVKRETPELYRERLAQLQQPGHPDYVRELESARMFNLLGENENALAQIESLLRGDHTPEVLLDISLVRTHAALALWWQGGSQKYTQGDCLMIAEHASQTLHEAPLYAHIIRWAGSPDHADPEAFLPDFFNLRYSTNKTADKDQGELKKLGLEGTEAFLLARISGDVLWENFDTFYALSMVYMCSGRQNLAHYTRRRAWELHEAGHHSRVPGASELTDIRPLTVFRQQRAGVLAPVKLVSDENRADMDTQYEARRDYAKKWNASRAEYARARLDAGNPAMDPMFWDAWEPPATGVPPIVRPAESRPPESTAPMPMPTHSGQEPETQPAEQTSHSKTWILLSILLGLLLIGGLVKARTSRAAAEPAPPEEKQP